MFDIQKELTKLPDQPGVYIMHDKEDVIIYIGKAVSLRKRVHQYFQKSHDEGIKKAQMVQHIDHFEYIITDSELEALVLECNLIKEHRPKYNTMLRDDKTYPYIQVTLGETFPRILFSRRARKDRSRYFGPFTSATAVKDTIELVQKLYHIRTCNRKFPAAIKKDRPCLNYHMKQCEGVCQGYISEEEYGKNVEAAMNFLNGETASVEKMLEDKMHQASDNMEFEEAVRFRDLLASVRQCVQKQKMTNTDGNDQDIVAMAAEGEDAVVQVFFVRNGRLIGRDHFFITIRTEEQKKDVLEAFVQQFYGGTPFIPREIFLQEEITNQTLTEEWLSEKKGQKVYLKIPKRGQKEKLLELAQKNAELVLSQDKEKIRREEGRTIGALKEIAGWLHLPSVNRLEAFDISNTSGYQSVGSMVVFEKGKPLRSDYRKFRLKTVEGPDDYASMREVLTRRFTHGISERKEREKKELGDALGSFTRFPDVIMMDGGRGQVNIALEVLASLHLSIPVCGMVKDDHHRTRGLYYQNTEIPIDKSSEGFLLITRLQDEAHRFAIEYHRSLRSKAQIHSFLDDITGIGATRRKALMKVYPGLDAIMEATVEQLKQVPSMNEKAAEELYAYLHKPTEQSTAENGGNPVEKNETL